MHHLMRCRVSACRKSVAEHDLSLHHFFAQAVDYVFVADDILEREHIVFMLSGLFRRVAHHIVELEFLIDGEFGGFKSFLDVGQRFAVITFSIRIIGVHLIVRLKSALDVGIAAASMMMLSCISSISSGLSTLKLLSMRR